MAICARSVVGVVARWSPALCLACGILFVATGWGALHWQPRKGTLISITRGAIGLYIWDTTLWNIDYRSGASLELDSWSGWHADLLPQQHMGGPSVARGPGQGQYVLAAPLWIPACAAAGFWWAARRRGWGRDPWRCAYCQYDLRGLAPGAVCPECGRSRDAG